MRSCQTSAPHDLRNSCATLLTAQGVNPRVVQDVFGHSAIALTLATYSHVVPTLAEEAAAKIDSARRVKDSV